MSEPFQPANSTDGMDFQVAWCARCQCEPEDFDDIIEGTEDGCPILAESYSLDVGDEGYPVELVEDEQGPRCLAFVERTCPGTIDPRARLRAQTAYDALPRDPVTGRPVI